MKLTYYAPVIAGLTGLLFIHLCFSFYWWDFNPQHWPINARGWWVACQILFNTVSLLICLAILPTIKTTLRVDKQVELDPRAIKWLWSRLSKEKVPPQVTDLILDLKRASEDATT